MQLRVGLDGLVTLRYGCYGRFTFVDPVVHVAFGGHDLDCPACITQVQYVTLITHIAVCGLIVGCCS